MASAFEHEDMKIEVARAAGGGSRGMPTGSRSVAVVNCLILVAREVRGQKG